MFRHAAALAAMLVAFAPARASGQVVVSAAVSLTEALQDIAAVWQARTGELVTLNVGASNMLARQIVAGARVDLFVSADEAQLAVVSAAGLVVPGTRVDLLGNQLAVAVSADRPLPMASPQSLLAPGVRRIAIGDPAGVPAGVYAREYLQSLGLWTAVQPRLVPAGSVRLALAALENGAADVAIVYRSDLRGSSRARAAYVVPPGEGPRIVYPAAVLTVGQHQAAAQRLLGFMQGAEASAILSRAGFVPLRAGKGTR